MSTKNIATPTKILNAFSSLRKCIKIVKTKYDFTEAITKAVATVKLLKFIPATATVIAVRVIKDIQTKTYIPYPGVCSSCFSLLCI